MAQAEEVVTAGTAEEAGEETDSKRPRFGTRTLDKDKDVFSQNAWDHVEWSDEQEARARTIVQAHNAACLPPSKGEELERDAGQNWEKFYSIHENRFFKDRHWLFTEFPELLPPGTTAEHVRAVLGDAPEDDGEGAGATSRAAPAATAQPAAESGEATAETAAKAKEDTRVPSASAGPGGRGGGRRKAARAADGGAGEEVAAAVVPPVSSERESPEALLAHSAHATRRILEVGCGVGNTVFPLLAINKDPGTFVYACDLSPTAIGIIRHHAQYEPRRTHAFVCDVTELPIFPDESLDVVILIFVLSAIHPDKMQAVINHFAQALRPGGVILFRDYGRYDLAQLRFKGNRCISENFYMRGDGTRVYFFTQGEMREMMARAGLQEEQNHADRRLLVNRSRQITMHRVWIQCKYVKQQQQQPASA
eukprot:m.78720 g.78720  ORF g.78720 m.78720 type:complete len:422 (-) comp13253_c0_seq4:32-1297(-)